MNKDKDISKRIKILYTIPNFDTAGSGKALLQIAQRLDKSLFETHIACLHQKGDLFQVVEKSGIPLHVFDFVSPARPILKLIKSCWNVSRKLRKTKPDLIHSFHYSSDYTEPLAAKIAGIPWIFTKKNMSWGGSSANSWKLRSAMAKGIIVQNTDMMEQFYPNSSKIKWIFRGVDIEKFKPNNPNGLIKKQLTTKKNERVLICVANFVPVKGIELLIEAFSLLSNSFPDWVLWLIGDDENEYGKYLHQLTKEKNLNHKVFFSGKQSEVGPYLDHAEIFVLPTKDEGRREGSPVALLEAMANEKVVLGSAVPGVKDQLNDFPEHMFTPGNIKDLQEKLTNLMHQTTMENKALGKKFGVHAQNHFTIEAEVAKHEEFYLKVLNK